MAKVKHFASTFLTLSLVFLVSAAPLLAQSTQQQPTQTIAAPPTDFTAKLATVEQIVDGKRKELGIPGAALVIVKDDKVIYMKGLGVKDFEKKIPVTPHTLFAIGSTTKAFTALAAVMSADEGKLSLEDSPRKFLPYFKMRDPDTDAKITIRDLLSHRSGLNRTDLAMATGVLSREELIRVASMAKPTAKLGEKFQYQNIMFLAAGEVVARAQNSSWDAVIADRIFKPLGMKGSATSVKTMQQSRDFSFGYEYNTTTKETRRLPMRDLASAAPAGAINSSASDMSQWLRFMLADGTFAGKRLVSEKGFNELISPQINIGPNVDCGLGWVLARWDGHKVVAHDGSIDGFNSLVTLMPDQKLGFALLTNVTTAPLGAVATDAIWTHLVGRKPLGEAEKVAAGSSVDPTTEVGKYKLGGAIVDVAMKEGKLVMTVPGQPPYPLENVTGRRYRLGAPAPDGFFATFRPAKSQDTETEIYLEQPQGNVVLPKAKATELSSRDTAKENAMYSGPLKELLGSYEQEQSKAVVEIGLSEGTPALVVPGQPPYPLEEKEKDKLRSPSLPDAYWVDVKRDAQGKILGMVLNQPEGQFPFRRLADPTPVSVHELLGKIIAAYGGEENIRKHKSVVTTVSVDFESQGLTGEAVVRARAPNSVSTSLTLMALGKKIGTIVNYFDGVRGGQTLSFAPEQTYTGKRLADVARQSGFYGAADWKRNFQTITFKRMAKVGEEDCYVLEMVPEAGNKVTAYISAKSYLMVRRESVISSETSGPEFPQSVTFSDHRPVEGVMIPFKAVNEDIATGTVVTLVKDVKFDVDLPDTFFHKPARQ